MLTLEPRLRFPALTLAALLAWPGGAGAQVVKGAVQALSGPVAGASLSTELNGERRAGGSTDGAGAFGVDLATLYSRSVPGSADLLLQFSAPGFVTTVRSMRVSQAAAAPLAVTMVPEGGGSALSAADQQKLAAFVNPAVGSGGALMLVPYDLPQELASPRLSERLRFNIERFVVTYVQTALGSEAPSLAVRLMPLDGAHDQDRLRAVGRHVNALAIVSGNGDRVGAGELAMSSSFVIPPQAGPVKPMVAFVDDRIDAAQLSSPELHRRLNRLWGRATILAMAARDLNAAPASGPTRVEALKRVRSYLVAERATTGPRNSEFVPEIDALLATIAREVKP
ncbi:MAG: hypothetical protein K8R60_18100 [Burkholderiales bacterium]|nr:hypothetical protein [Burkholderiales bacterium]